MNELRKAAEQALDALDSDNPDIQLRAALALRQALAQRKTLAELLAATPVDEYQYEVVAEHADGTYTTKRIPKRQWVGLTDEEKNELVDAFYGTDIQRLEAVEAKLKEKNGG